MQLSLLALLGALALPSAAVPHARDEGQCKQTTVAILGGGMAGIAAAQTLHNASMEDFMILEYRDTIGGRAWHKPFGQDKDGNPYIIEMGCNWVQGLGTHGGPQNPVWTLAQVYNLSTIYSNYSNVSTYNQYGYKDFSQLIDIWDDIYDTAAAQAGVMLLDNLQDQTAKTGLALAGWRPKVDDMEAQAVDWWSWDFEDAYTPLESSFIFGVAGQNLTVNGFSDEDNFVIDQRGYSHIIHGMASTFLKPNDTRLLLNNHITNISYSDSGVTVHSADGSCVRASYAICTFSLGVLQNNAVTFTPSLPEWKKESIEGFTMATYTKIFLQFNETFWPEDTQYFLYADPYMRGYYPVFQSLSTEGFFPGSNIIFVTVTEQFAWRAERQSDEKTKAEVMEVLRKMFPEKNIPDPIAFMYPRWTLEPWAYGSYSNWPPSTTLEMHENLRANAGRLWFAGEATSPTYFGFLHGAWFEGQAAGLHINSILNGTCKANTTCKGRKHYETLHGTTPLADYSFVDGWNGNSFYDFNDD
ncbi:flavin-containing polyamine oxidase [Aspergillus costaricaensis CBS 115574]|uniref:Flavin-containing polyamine oxidase n=1 Tax=Aspergillus costaricaensis CBS 115574 TaxID=1448317 RepID=A0ACD1I3R4_9EURO|nr:flavin-containing polyamine oxidase [Aspergillus costaricaensis CBS 115574]RAK84929.1 flavin-containing polyamine oxidase [Aspergillus costaricaensis CBS 115574]